MKYLIDIDEVPFEKDGVKLYKATNFNALVFDKEGLHRMQKYLRNPEVIKTADNVWDFAKEIRSISAYMLKKIFGVESADEVMNKYSYWQAQMTYNIWKNNSIKDPTREELERIIAGVGFDKVYDLVQKIKDGDRNAIISYKCNCDY